MSENTPNLGLATTGQLLDELHARCEINGTLNYSTVGVPNEERPTPLHKLPPLERVEKEFAQSRGIDYVQFYEDGITADDIGELRAKGHPVIFRENHGPGNNFTYVKKFGPVESGVQRIVSVWRQGHSGPPRSQIEACRK